MSREEAPPPLFNRLEWSSDQSGFWTISVPGFGRLSLSFNSWRSQWVVNRMVNGACISSALTREDAVAKAASHIIEERDKLVAATGGRP